MTGNHTTSAGLDRDEAPRTYLDLFWHWAGLHPDQPFVTQMEQGGWRTTTWGEAAIQIRKIMAALIDLLGRDTDERIVILGQNSLHWYLADLAGQAAGQIVAGVLTTSLPEQVAHCFRLTGAKLLFLGPCENWAAVRDSVPEDVYIVAMPGVDEPRASATWDQILAKFPPVEDIRSPDIDKPRNIIFTSGTTGLPKAVVHSLRSVTAAIAPFVEFDDMRGVRFINYLPMGHGAERIVVGYQMISTGGQIVLSNGPKTFLEDMALAKVDWFIAPPRLWLAYQKMTVHALGGEAIVNRLLDDPATAWEVGEKFRELLSLSADSFLANGTAPLSAEVHDWFSRAGVRIYNTYGQSEISPITLNTPRGNKVGSVGTVAYGAEIRLSPAGEILVRAPGCMLGYYNMPEKTAETIVDGWVHTGDRGTVDEDGFYYIIGRLSEEFKTSKGKFVAPVPIEGAMAKNELIAQQMLCGRGMAQTVALIVLSENAARYTKKEIEDSIYETVINVNEKQEKHAQIALIIICKDNWTSENKLMSQMGKILRNQIEEKYRNLIHKVEEDPYNLHVLWE